jgi:hypothetical protein
MAAAVFADSLYIDAEKPTFAGPSSAQNKQKCQLVTSRFAALLRPGEKELLGSARKAEGSNERVSEEVHDLLVKRYVEVFLLEKTTVPTKLLLKRGMKKRNQLTVNAFYDYQMLLTPTSRNLLEPTELTKWLKDLDDNKRKRDDAGGAAAEEGASASDSQPAPKRSIMSYLLQRQIPSPSPTAPTANSET